MIKFRNCVLVAVACVVALIVASSWGKDRAPAKKSGQAKATPVVANVGDWPQWRGPLRDAISTDTGLLGKWESDGPPLAWKAKGLGQGYSSLSVADGKIFTM